MVISHFRKLAAASLFSLSLMLSGAYAETGTNTGTFQQIIKNQMNAFATGDARKAFSFATGTLQRRFQTPEFFMEMVRQGYKPVYKPQSVTFGRSKMTSVGPTQEVFVTGPEGKNWVALYSFEEQDDGTWRISGCYLTKSEGFAA